MKFKEQAYARDLKRAIGDELISLDPLITGVMKGKIGAVEFRSVDAKYKAAAVDSVKTQTRQKVNTFITSIGAGGEVSKQNQGFRAVYYNYGTGNQMKPPAKWTEGQAGGWGGWNMARKGRDIYQRPKGTWVDLGGNKHVSKLKGTPRKLSNKGLGREIEPTFWFDNGLQEVLGMFDEAVHSAVKRVPLSAYIEIRSIRKRM